MLHFGLILLFLASALGMPAELPLLPGAIEGDTSPKYVPFREVGGRIISGEPAVRGQFPWQAALYVAVSGGTAFCGGSLILPHIILTAAHCVTSAQGVTAYLGVTSLGDTENRVTAQATRAFVHGNYSGNTIANDIALLELSTSVVIDGVYVKTIQLAEYNLGADVVVSVSGWGRTSDSISTISQTLNYVTLTTISNEVCINTYNIVQSGIVCARGTNIESTCNGDSGGPLMVGTGDNAALVGIVSFGHTGGCAIGHPVGFTRVDPYLSWISAQIGPIR